MRGLTKTAHVTHVEKVKTKDGVRDVIVCNECIVEHEQRKEANRK